MSEYVDGSVVLSRLRQVVIGEAGLEVTGSLPVPILEVTGSLPVPIVRAYAASRRGPAAAAPNLGFSE
jgi:hypothetical protein